MNDEWEYRVAAILGVNTIKEEGSELTEEDFFELPSVSSETLELYGQYLKQKLIFPFEANYDRETGPLAFTTFQVKVKGLDEFSEEFYGLFCEGREGRRKVVLPLADLNVRENDPNYILIDDYQSWFWNHR